VGTSDLNEYESADGDDADGDLDEKEESSQAKD
jgi:hypothetical protein